MHNIVVPKKFIFFVFYFSKHICIFVCVYKCSFVGVHISIQKCILCTNAFAKCAGDSKSVQ